MWEEREGKGHNSKTLAGPCLDDRRPESMTRKDGMSWSQRKYHLDICQDVQSE